MQTIRFSTNIAGIKEFAVRTEVNLLTVSFIRNITVQQVRVSNAAVHTVGGEIHPRSEIQRARAQYNSRCVRGPGRGSRRRSILH